MFADVVMPIPLDRAWTYRVPEGAAVEPGMRVVAPLGTRVATGVVVGVRDQAGGDLKRLRTLTKVLDETPALSPDLIALGRWLATYYACSWGEALAVMLPALYRPIGRERFRLAEPSPGGAAPRGPAAEILRRLAEGPSGRRALLADLGTGASRALEQLCDDGVVLRETRLPKHRTTVGPPAAAATDETALELTPHQSEALAAVTQAVESGRYEAFLIHGVTGSGKTEIYLRAIASALAGGRGAILLVPEIALTPQTCARVTARFGGLVAVLHSRLTPGERAAAWARLRAGEARIALGARSAIFAPVRELGLIVVDEEPEPSYKQEDAPRYHARDVAAVRARALKAVLVLGSATPSIEAYHNAESGRYRLLTLPERVVNRPLPTVRLVGMDLEQDETGRPAVFSGRLLDALADRLAKREQSILFLNRRGYAPVVMCPDCRTVLTCPDCSLALVYHQDHDRLHCHACGRTLPARPACPQCGTLCARLVGAGTQRVEEELRRRLPKARLLRLDFDSTRERGALERSLAAFGRREADILLGTQMVAKGIDFPGVTLVGIISADTALHLPDFRAEERTFQLIVQVAGRAGRGETPGEVLVQTRHADHPVLLLARDQDYAGFYRRELAARRDLEYPPFARLASLLFRGTHAQAARQAAETAAARLRRVAGPKDQVLGPAPAPRERVAREERFLLLLKSPTVSARARLLAELKSAALPAGVKLSVDVDPQDLL